MAGLNIRKLLGGPMKWAASLGGGTLAALLVGVLVEIGMDQTSAFGLAVTAAVGSLAFKFCGWVAAEYGPAPVKP